MEKSGQGHTPRHSTLIINRPDLQSPQQKLVSGLLTMVFWLLWALLWLPLITLAAWAFFGVQLHVHMIELEGYAGFFDLLSTYAMIIVAMGGTLVVWAKYNHFRFRGMDRRKAAAPVSIDMLASFAGHSPLRVAQWREMRVMTVEHDANGRILAIRDDMPVRSEESGSTGRQPLAACTGSDAISPGKPQHERETLTPA